MFAYSDLGQLRVMSFSERLVIIWPWKSKVKVIAQGHNVGIAPHWLIYLFFHVHRPSHSRDTAISKFDVENSWWRSWVKSKLKVTTWVQHSVDLHPFRSMSIGHPIRELRLFQNLTFKIKGQGHGWGHSSESQCGSSILSTHTPLVPCQSGHPIPELELFQNLTLKIKGQGHGWGHSSKSQCGSNILLTHIPFIPCQSALPFLRYSIFKIWPWKSRVKFMGEVTVQSHSVGLTSCRLTSLSFHVNWVSHSWDTAFSKFDLENPGSRSNDHDVAQLQA